MKDKKPFFYRIEAATFLLEVVTTPENERAQKFYQLALDMVSGRGTFPYSKQIIAEVKQFKEKKSAAGQKGMKNRWLRDNSDITNDNSDITKSNSVITRSSTEAVTEAVTEAESLKSKTLSGKPDAIPYQKILDTMNRILNTGYKNTGTFKKLIRTRINEGFAPEDFETVCRKKFQEWGSDLKMMQYLRPDTLFSSKMNSYLGSQTGGRPVGDRERINHAAGQAFLEQRERNVWTTETL